MTVLPIPPHYDPNKVGKIWKVSYQKLAEEAKKWVVSHQLRPAAKDNLKICLLLIDVQNTFCIPDFELFVAGRSGVAAVRDNQRLCQFIYRNLDCITQISCTMDTHQSIQIFHPIFFINQSGEHPEPYTIISSDDVDNGYWKINPEALESLGLTPPYGESFLRSYSRALEKKGKYNLTIWPYHAMLGGIGHAIVPAVEEAIFFHSIARLASTTFHIKGDTPLTENYSAIKPEVMYDHSGKQIAQEDRSIVNKLVDFDAVFIAGQAKSHCVAWSIEDLYKKISTIDVKLASKIYILQDCMSPVVVSEVIDYTDEADRTFEKFAERGMNLIDSTQSIRKLPGAGP